MLPLRSRLSLSLLLGLLFAVPPALAGQQAGTLQGRVLAANSMRPLPGAQVMVLGVDRAALVTASGTFSITDIPPGEYTVRAQMLGYATIDRTVTVAAGSAQSLEFLLMIEALALDELVVTGTAGFTERRAIGNVVDRVRAAEVLETSPATSVNQLISQRSPGVVLMPASGQVGAAAPIHIRGISSMSLGSEPIIYIDGVRMDSRSNQGPAMRGGARMSRLDDLNPEDIESIEIIKGPAAATLYGTEASNGVIQVVTKRGAEGRAEFDFTLRMGTNWLWNPEGRQGFTYAGNPYAGQLDSINIYAHERDNGLGDPFQYGSIQSLTANARGGSSALRYFASVGWSDDVGVFDYNWQKQFTARSNVDFVLSESLGAKVGMGYVQRTLRSAQRTLATDAFGNMTWGSPAFLNTRTRGYRNGPPEASEEVDARTTVDRFTGSFELNHNPFDWFTHRAIAGIDVGLDETSTLYPRHPDGTQHFWGSLSLGDKSVDKATNRIITLDYGASATLALASELESTSSLGFQYYKREDSSIGSTGSNFAAPPLTTVSAGATRNGSENFLENATVGVYFQQQFGWLNRRFITMAVRADDNSAFGSDFDVAIYPKVSGTWVVHEEPFWSLDWVNQFRVRGAWGAAGQQPSAFAAVRLYQPVTGFNDEPGLQPAAIGNSELKPERSQELEIGFDASFLNDRLQVVYTRYDRTVVDAMVNRPIPDSEGFPGTQIVNLGEVKAWGNELQVDLRVMDSPRFAWDLGVGLANFRNRIESLGGIDAVGTGAQRQIEGFSIGDQYWKKVLSAEFVNGSNGAVRNIMCDGGTGKQGLEMGGAPVPCDEAPWVWWGHSQPTWQANLNQTLTFGGLLRLNATVEANGGHIQRDLTPPAAHTSYCITRACRFQDDPIFQSYRAIGRDPLGMYEGGMARLREVSATFTLPESWASKLAASRGSVSLAARNVMMLWTAQHGWDTPRDGLVIVPIGQGRIWDPEVRATGSQAGSFQTTMPPLASAVFTVRLGY
jgi:TonB-linked SusC/RagA family outer membrane protein